MSPRAAARLVRLYPPRWRERYRDEFTALLEDHPSSPRALLDVARGACRAHLESCSRSAHPALALLCAWIVACFAGMVLWETVDDTSLPLGAAWIGIETGAAIAGLAAVAFAAALISRWRGVLRSLAIPFLLGIVVVVWIAAVLFATGGRWGASPWAVAMVSVDSPSAAVPAAVRWLTASITAALLVAFFFAAAKSLGRVLRVRDLTPPLARFIARGALAGFSIMTASVALWGIVALGVAASAMRQANGPLGVTTLTAWIACALLMLLATLLALRALAAERA